MQLSSHFPQIVNRHKITANTKSHFQRQILLTEHSR